ncbi:hypothetical protein AUEXF2481DRAFT_513213 [Aureobasidium subglaciale EXF-2481]|uniref:Uncharacterized protein n=1 Tax=Aureobasidium subglaciale (strain EXF-2481) TaxID=1043005 RepID=A0A074YAP1_AURSE|nr:uncharacterized protein AUEXF2481DRAFT_513213 [Aureobasidium subglaciale EXF-2481]KEQ91217.1 hypothetical protein AUEXF2481DRAFT_513213 [Aureobasidium subglaciale EXF-2481]
MSQETVVCIAVVGYSPGTWCLFPLPQIHCGRDRRSWPFQRNMFAVIIRPKPNSEFSQEG